MVIRCPSCKKQDTRVIESRSSDDGSAIRRRRKCPRCEKRFTTYERIEDQVVIKTDGSKEAFNRDKILNGILKACEKRKVDPEAIEATVDWVEDRLRAEFEKEVPVEAIGQLVMDKLKELDEVAYVRFASVYKRFEAASDFAELSNKLKDI
ncbi:transcriptional repressor NrdR [Desulfitispora alkaliphila]|uniref:transcriptional regulator NrdR n=1 Tax=Desulfitispora alkaliphila TaxID=622674 RepID=UPI003D21B7E1